MIPQKQSFFFLSVFIILILLSVVEIRLYYHCLPSQAEINKFKFIKHGMVMNSYL